jgi:hypothetical protein
MSLTFTTNTYVAHHLAADAALNAASAIRKGSFYHLINAQVMSAFMFESYLNHVINKNPNRFFDLNLESIEEKWREKFKKVSTEYGLNSDLGYKNNKSIGDAFRFRNAMAHGQTVTNVGITDKVSDNPFGLLKPDWEKSCTEKNVRRIFNDLSSIIISINQKAFPTTTAGFPFSIYGSGSGYG